jgi:hypothetical protein
MEHVDIARIRLRQQELHAPRSADASVHLRHMAAIQGQEYELSLWGIGLRLPHLRQVDLEADMQSGRMIRTHLLRPTWHLVAAEDVRWLLGLTAPRVHAANAFMYRKLELPPETLVACADVLTRALAGGHHLQRRALAEALAAAGWPMEGMRLGYVMMYAELEGLICSGPRQGRQFTYALMDERVAPAPAWPREEALAELMRRYFRSRGPATVQDASVWSGLTLGDVRKGIQLLDKELNVVQCGEQAYYLDAAADPKPGGEERLLLLPIYDEMIMGYQNRDALLQFQTGLQPPPRTLHNCMILDGGQIIGTWKRTAKGRALQLELDFFRPLDARQEEALALAKLRFGEFCGMKVLD